MKLPRIRRCWSMNFLFCDAWGIQVEKSPWTGKTGQPYPQMGPAHLSTCGCMGAGQSFTATLNPALIDPLDAPIFKQRGIMLVGWQPPRPRRWSGREPPVLVCPPAMEAEDSGSTFSGSWVGGLDMVVVGVWWCLLAGGWAIDLGDWDRAPRRSPYKPSVLEPATASSTFWRPSVLRHWASSLQQAGPMQQMQSL